MCKAFNGFRLLQFDIPMACAFLAKSYWLILKKVAYELKSYPETVPSFFPPTLPFLPIIHSDARVARQHGGSWGIGAVCSYERRRDGIAMTPAVSPMVNSAIQAICVRLKLPLEQAWVDLALFIMHIIFSSITFRQSEWNNGNPLGRLQESLKSWRCFNSDVTLYSCRIKPVMHL